jgi:hypothetical protein
VNSYSVKYDKLVGTSTTASWDKPDGSVDSYTLVLTPATAGMTVPSSVTTPTAELKNLTPGTTYTLKITPKVGTSTLTTTGDPTSDTFTTRMYESYLFYQLKI